MFDEKNEDGDAIYTAYQDPAYLQSRIETIAKIAIRAVEILDEEGRL
jgi:hypothetical protein